jgi:hypothetical protein
LIGLLKVYLPSLIVVNLLIPGIIITKSIMKVIGEGRHSISGVLALAITVTTIHGFSFSGETG